GAAGAGACLLAMQALSGAQESCAEGWVPTFGELPGVTGGVGALAVFDDGSGPALYLAGDFNTAGSLPVRDLARWDGSSWSAPGVFAPDTGASTVHALTVFDDGSGPALYAAGVFSSVD